MLRHPGSVALVLDAHTTVAGGTYRCAADLAKIACNAIAAFGADQLLCTSRPLALGGRWRGVQVDAGLHTASELYAVLKAA
jgi:hypothetical protein